MKVIVSLWMNLKFIDMRKKNEKLVTYVLFSFSLQDDENQC